MNKAYQQMQQQPMMIGCVGTTRAGSIYSSSSISTMMTLIAGML